MPRSSTAITPNAGTMERMPPKSAPQNGAMSMTSAVARIAIATYAPRRPPIQCATQAREQHRGRRQERVADVAESRDAHPDRRRVAERAPELQSRAGDDVADLQGDDGGEREHDRPVAHAPPDQRVERAQHETADPEREPEHERAPILERDPTREVDRGHEAESRERRVTHQAA